MPDYYIRTLDQNDSRGPFDLMKLQTLGEVNQINENTLYYDESKEEWIPFALNKELCAQIFPEPKKLKLKIRKSSEQMAQETEPKDPGGNDIQEMLSAAEGNTKQRKALKNKEESQHKTANISPPALGFMMITSALVLLYPQFDLMNEAINNGTYAVFINHPFILLGMIDLILGILLFLAVTEVYPLLRGRGMLTLGFGAYVGWSLGDPFLIGASVAAGLGIFIATITQRLSIMLVALVLGIGGNGYLLYLATLGRLDGFFESISFNLI